MALQSSGAISLNDIHVEVNGTSGTTCSLNDSDIRGLIDKGNNATSSFNEFYGAANITHIVASGGSTTTSGNYKFHYFNSSGTFTINTAGVGGSQYTTVDYICIAGGGAGANACPGGGAGGYRVGTFTGSAGSRTITIGGGGTGNNRGGTNSNGSNSSIGGVVTSTGGGKAAQGGRNYAQADAAGSGGSGVVIVRYRYPMAFPCDASGVIAHGAPGSGCTSTLADGTTCAPTCDSGYTLSGTRSCSAGILTDNTNCEPDPCTASLDNPNKNGDDGVHYCINDGTVTGATGSCLCSGCKDGYHGPSCETAGA